MSELLHYPTNYLETLQQAALAFLRRHRGEHLGEQELFSRAVGYLTTTMKANRAIAENTVARAYGELTSANDQRHMDISLSTSSMAVLVDPNSGIHYAVSVSLIFDRLIDTPHRRRLSVVKKAVH